MGLVYIDRTRSQHLFLFFFDDYLVILDEEPVMVVLEIHPSFFTFTIDGGVLLHDFSGFKHVLHLR